MGDVHFLLETCGFNGKICALYGTYAIDQAFKEVFTLNLCWQQLLNWWISHLQFYVAVVGSLGLRTLNRNALFAIRATV